MSFKITYPPAGGALNNILGGGSIPAPNYLKFVTLAALSNQITMPAGSFMQRISATDAANPLIPVTVTSPDLVTEYSSLDLSAGSAVDLVDIYFPVATVIQFNNLNAGTVVSVQYYRHPS